jgi:hypothetical protein
MSAVKTGNRIEFYEKDSDFNFLANTIEGFPINVKMAPKGFQMENLDIACTETLFQVSKGLANKTGSRDAGACFNDLKTDRRYTTGGLSASYRKPHVLGFDDPNNPFKDNNSYTGNDYPTQHIDGTSLDVKERIMYEALMMKATQHPHILKCLLDPSNKGKQFIEDTSLAPMDRHNDTYWGVGRAKGPDAKERLNVQGNGRNALGKLWNLVQQDLAKEMNYTGEVQVRCGFSPNVANILNVESQQFDHTRAITQQKLDALPLKNKATLPTLKQNPQSQSYSSDMGTDATQAQNLFTTPKKPVPQQNQMLSQPLKPNPMPVQPATIHSTPLASAKHAPTASDTALNAFKMIGPVKSFAVADDTYQRGKKILKLQFNDHAAAIQFQKDANTKGIQIDAKNIKDKMLILGEDKAQFICEKFGVASFGRTNPQWIMDAVIYDAEQKSQQMGQARAIPDPAQPPQYIKQPTTSAHDSAVSLIRGGLDPTYTQKPIKYSSEKMQTLHPDIPAQKVAKFCEKLNEVSLLVPATVTTQLTGQPDLSQTSDKIHKVAQNGPPLLPISNAADLLSSSEADLPKFDFKDGKYDITLPKHFSGQVFVPRLDKDMNIVGHDLLAYKNNKLDAPNCFIQNPKEQSNIPTKTVDECRKAQQQYIDAPSKSMSHAGYVPRNPQHTTSVGAQRRYEISTK